MLDADAVQYSSVPECESWIIPLWDARDYDEFGDLATSIRLRGPSWFAEAQSALRTAMSKSDVYGVKLYIGTDFPDRVTLTLRPDTQQQAIDILKEASSFMAPRGVVPWETMRRHLEGILSVVSSSTAKAVPSFGFGVVIDDYHERHKTIAPTSWIARQLQDTE